MIRSRVINFFIDVTKQIA